MSARVVNQTASLGRVRLPSTPWSDEVLGSSHRHGLADADAQRVHDVCVIGSGASGAVVADELARQGRTVLMVEEGGYLAPSASNAAVDRISPKAVVRDESSPSGWSEDGWPWTTRNLGGGTVFYGGASFRYQSFDFDPTSRIRVDGLDVRWPFSAAELDPYYDMLEARLGIRRRHSHLDEDGLDVRSEGGTRLWEAGARLGYSPRPTPMAVAKSCDRHTLCISHQCPTGAKGDSVAAFLRPMANNEGFELRTGLRAVRLIADSVDRVGAIECVELHTGRRFAFRARTFVVACNAIQSAALLLRSHGEQHLRGIGNEFDMVGRGLCMKLSEYVRGIVDVPGVDRETALRRGLGPFSTVCFLDHYLDENCPTGVGGLIYESRSDEPDDFEADKLLLRVETIISDHPSRENRVRLSKNTDEFGIPKVVIDYRTDPRDAARLEWMVERSKEIVAAAGARNVRCEPSGYAKGSCHLHGTCRAGEDRRDFVLDPSGRVHGVDNVYVADGSFMPYPAGLNPTLTIQAFALRCAETIHQRM